MHFFGINLHLHSYLALLFVPLLALGMVKNLKYLTPVSLIAAIMTAWGLVVTFYYILQDLPHTSSVKAFAGWHRLPLYFGTAIYAFEGIGVVRFIFFSNLYIFLKIILSEIKKHYINNITLAILL